MNAPARGLGTSARDLSPLVASGTAHGANTTAHGVIANQPPHAMAPTEPRHARYAARGMQRDHESLGRSLLRVGRPQLDAARVVAAAYNDPRAAWEACAARGLIPVEWTRGDALRGPGRI